MKNRILEIFTIASILLLASACSNAFDKAPVENNTEQTREKASLVLKVNKSDSRTILAPDFTLEEMKYTLKGKKNGSEETTIKSDLSYSELTSGSKIIVDVGKWDFTLLASKNGTPRYKAEIENMDVVTGENSLSFNLEDFPQNGGKGSFSVSLKFPNDEIVATVKAGLFDTEGNVVSEYEELSATSYDYGKMSVTYEKSDVPSGIYIISFKFFKKDGTEIKPGYSELVQVKDDRTSKAERILENLERLHSITYNLNDGKLSNDSLPSSFYEYQRITLPTADDILRNGYTFGGWYENPDFSGEVITEIPSLTTTNKTFYAKWFPITYKITYEGLDGAENPNPETYTSDDEIDLLSLVSTQDGMAFAGWFKEEKVIASLPKGSYGDIVLTANWKPGKGFSADELDTLNSWLSSQSGEGPFDVIVTGRPSLSTINIALQNNSSKKVNLDLSGAEITEITEINNNTFYDCTSLASVELPDSMTTIGYRAFYNCTSLASVEIPASVASIGIEAFSGCTSLASVEIGNSVKTIGYYAFYNCTSLANVKIGNAVTEIGSSAFNGCTSLASVVIPDSVTTIEDYAFEGCTRLANVEIGNSVTSIGSYAFQYCTSLASVVIPDSVTTIGDFAFYTCTSLASVEIGNSVTSIGSYAFSSTSLANVVIPDSVTTIGDSAFSGCTSLASVVIPDSVTSIGDYTFSGCTSLASVVIGNSVTSIGRYAFYKCENLKAVYAKSIAAWCGISFADDYSNPLYYANQLYINGTEAKNIIIPDSVSTINAYAFIGCTTLASVEIGNSVTTIGDSAFSGCTSLKAVYAKSITAWCEISFADFSSNPLCHANQLYIDGTEAKNIIIPDSITTINDYAFLNCKSLASVTIPDSVASIDRWAFSGCTSLASVTIPDSVTSIGDYAFSSTSLVNVTIPDSVASIGRWAFSDCASLSSVKIGNGLTEIGSEAFSGCTSLASVEIGNSVTSIGESAFSGCKSLASVEIPDSVTSIGSHAFYYCTRLASVKIGNGVTEIGSETFGNCENLASVKIGNGVTEIGESAFRGCTRLKAVYVESIAALCGISFANLYSTPFYYANQLYINDTEAKDIIIPDSITTIKAYAFYNCTNLESVEIPDSVTSIGDYAFLDCRNLKTVYAESIASWCRISFDNGYSNPLCYAKQLYINGIEAKNIIIPESVTKISNYAFGSCTSLVSVEIPDSVKTIDNSAFSNCTNLESLKIGNNVTTIGEKAFINCTSLSSVEIPDSVKTIGSEAFNHCKSLETVKIGNGVASISDNMFKSCTNLVSVEIGNSVIAIGNYAFNGCTSLASIEIPDSVTTINNYAFSDCTSLASVEIGKNVATLSIFAFYNCENLASVNIPSNLTNIGQSAFQNCNNLETVTFENTTGWYYTNSSVGTSGTDIDVMDASTNAENLRINTWGDYYLKRKK